MSTATTTDDLRILALDELASHALPQRLTRP